MGLARNVESLMSYKVNVECLDSSLVRALANILDEPSAGFDPWTLTWAPEWIDVCDTLVQ